MKHIVFIGDAAETIDLCRFTAINIHNKKMLPLVIDASIGKSLYYSVNGRNAEGLTDARGIYYSDSRLNVPADMSAYDVLLIYCEREEELEDVLDNENPAFVVLAYGVGRLSYEKACNFADIIGERNKECTLIYRKRTGDITVDTIRHLVDVKHFFLAPHTDTDYDVFEKVDYGSNKLCGLSESMLSAVNEISLAAMAA